MTIDWGAGRYENTAAELAPVAEHVVLLAGLQPGERVLDLACGTGNAALLAAGAGATATGIDTAPRLVEVAAARAAEEGLEATFVAGDVQRLPFEDGAFDVVVSVFGVIFAPDAQLAFDELMRVLRPGGRAFVTAWIPAGPIDAMVGVLRHAIGQANGGAPPPFPWRDPEAVAALAARHHAELRVHDAELAITGGSPEAYFSAFERTHPMSVTRMPLLERSGDYAAVRARAVAALAEGNEDQGGFRVHSPYRVLELHKRS